MMAMNGVQNGKRVVIEIHNADGAWRVDVLARTAKRTLISTESFTDGNVALARFYEIARAS